MSGKKLWRSKRNNRSLPPGQHHIPHVLLLIDTASVQGRGFIHGIGRYALEHGPWSIQFITYRALDSLPPQWLKEWRGDGIISRTSNESLLRMLWSSKFPVIELHGHPKMDVAQVRLDVEKEVQMVVEHFLSCGLRQFAFFSFGDAWSVRSHLRNYRRLLEARGYDCHAYQPPESQHSAPVWRESQRPGLIRWLRELPRPIGVFTPGDNHSMLLLDMCREVDIPVPEEMAILGLGNDPVICGNVRPTLSSVDLNAPRIGYEAAALLDRIFHGKKDKEAIFIPPSHVAVRQSTDLVAIEDSDVAQAVRMIREFACKGIEVSDIAENIGLSRRALERRFRQCLGRTPKAEIMRVRIERAKRLMAETDQTSENIGHKSGFSSLAYFHKVFRREVKMKPQAYRKMQRLSRNSGESTMN
jgi:LacI family transcriptional regulator